MRPEPIVPDVMFEAFPEKVSAVEIAVDCADAAAPLASYTPEPIKVWMSEVVALRDAVVLVL
jgi:hypothetical protein